MLGRISIRQFNEWREYADLEPWDERRADLRTASIVCALVNLLGRRRGQPPIRLEDCALQLQTSGRPSRARAQTREEIVRAMTLLTAMTGGEVPAPQLVDASGRPVSSSSAEGEA